MFRGEHAEDIARRHRWSRPIKPPVTPPRRDPNDVRIPSDAFDDEDDDFDFDDDADDDNEPS